MPSRPRIVVLGIMSKVPFPGVVWQTMHYLDGFRRLGCEVFYVEAHAANPSNFMTPTRPGDDGSGRAADFIARIMGRFGLGDGWAYQALHHDGRCYGMSESRLKDLYREADLIINLHGATRPRPEHVASGRLIFLETDPVQLQVELLEERPETIEFLEPHIAFFTFGENLGGPSCPLPVSERFRFLPTRQPVVMDLWEKHGREARDVFTTVGNWRQGRNVELEGETYYWSKSREFRRFLDLPRRSGLRFELALAGIEDEEKGRLERKGWGVVQALGFGRAIDSYRGYIQESRGEFTVAKDQNVRLRTGWFSDRSATYLAAGRPVVTQDTGFSEILPTGEGLLPFLGMDDVLEALERINGDYARHSRGATALAHEYFSHEVVLGRLLQDLGVSTASTASSVQTGSQEQKMDGDRGRRRASIHEPPVRPFPPDLVIEPVSRRPPVLPDDTLSVIDGLPAGDASREPSAGGAQADAAGHTTGRVGASIVVVTFNQVAYTKLCIESLLANTTRPRYEVIVVDNGSSDATGEYLEQVSARHPHVRILQNRENLGFARACNQGLASAKGKMLILLNNDTIVPPGWMRLLRHLRDPNIGLVGPVTNRCGNEAEIDAPYRTYGELTGFARRHVRRHAGSAFDIRTLTMFCVAMRRDVHQTVGPLDERFEVGMFEDDDYSIRMRRAGYRVVCAEDSFVHHLGQGSFGELIPDGDYGRLFDANRQRLEEKWGMTWQPYEKRPSARYRELTRRLREVADRELPAAATVLIASRGDDRLLSIDGRRAWHFPQDEEGRYPGHYPSDSREAIGHLESLRSKGAEYLMFPATSLWWLEYYPEFRQHLDRAYRTIVEKRDTCVLYELREGSRRG